MAGETSALRRDLRRITRDGVAFGLMVGVGETYVPAFALAAGAGDVAAGLLAILPMLAGGLLQLLAPAAVSRVGSYRAWTAGCVALQALSFAPLVVGALAGRLSVAWMFAAWFAYWGFGMAAGPAWNAWVGELVPPEQRARFFARRARLSHVALLVGILAGGAWLGGQRPASAAAGSFAALFLAAAASRLVSAWLLSRHSEPPGLVDAHRIPPLLEGWAALSGSDAWRVLAYLLAMQAAVHIAAPFFTPYMLGPLELSYAGFTVLIATALAARIAVMPLLGRQAQRRGTRPLLWAGALAVVPLPSLWLVSDAFAWLLFVQVLSGVAWATLEFATLLSFFEELEPRLRTSVLAVFNFANAAAAAVGAVAGGWLLHELGAAPGAYAALFAVSSLARLVGLACLPRGRPLPQPGAGRRGT